MSECGSIGALLDGYHDRELGSLERERVERHLADCSTCRDDLASLEQLGGWVRAAVGSAPEPALWDAIAARLPSPRPAQRTDRARSAPVSARRRRWLPPLAVAAAAAAAVLLETTSDSGRLASIVGATSGVVRSVYANERPVLVLEPESSNDATIIWLMDELGEQSPEVSESVRI